jgi:DNA-binding transcriptional MerR regulator
MSENSDAARTDASQPRFGIEELCSLSGVTRRTVRFYTQKGLLDPPEGAKRGAHYTRRHLEQLLLIRQWADAGVSLERIGRLLNGDSDPLPFEPAPGTVEVWSRITLRPGLEVHLEPGRLGLDAEQVRGLVKQFTKLAEDFVDGLADDLTTTG